MKFASPEILFALFSLIIPIIIHLFNFKRFKKVYFSNLGFLKQVTQQSKKTSQLRHLLVLLSRMFFLAFLVLAFAKPYFPKNDNSNEHQSAKRIVVYIDNSFSMQQRGSKGVLLEEAKALARELSSAFRPTDKYKLVSNDIYLFDGGFVSRDDFMSDLRNTGFLPFSLKLSEVVEKANASVFHSDQKPTDVFLISDFQKSISDLSQFAFDSSVNVWLVPLKAPVPANIYIDSCWIDDPIVMSHQPVTLKYRIAKNYAGEDISTNVRLFINGKQKVINSLALSDEPMVESLSFIADSSSSQNGYIELSDHPITFDDRFYFSLNVNKSYKVILINNKNEKGFLDRFYNSDSVIEFISFNQNQIDYNAFNDANLLILDGIENITSGFLTEIEKFTANGGNLVFIPTASFESTSFDLFIKHFGLSASIGVDTSKISARKIDVQSSLFKDVFTLNNNKLPENTNLPYFKFRHRWASANSFALKTEIELADGQPLLSSFKYKLGNVFVFSAAIDLKNSNLGRHALFIPLFYNLMLNKSVGNVLYYSLDDEVLLIPSPKMITEVPIQIVNSNKSINFIPGMKKNGGIVQLFPEGRILESGNYMATTTDYSYPLSFNYSAAESKLDCFNKDEIEEQIEEIGNNKINVISGSNINIQAEILSTKNQNELWKIFIVIALMFLVIEVLLLRFLK